jgi:outer membrane protein OmpA-like peptidoglycan-associated protein
VKKTTGLIFLFLLQMPMWAVAPEWVAHLPFSEDAFWGVGSGASLEIAVEKGKQDILMQLCSRVEAVISMETRSDGGEEKITEKLDAVIGGNSLRGASVESTYEEDGKFWVLMKYCDDCGEMLVGSALRCIEEELASDVSDILERFEDKTTVQAIILERRLHELNLEDYNSEDISLILDGKKIVIMIMNFLPNDDELTPSQEKGLTLLSRGLLSELESMNYTGVSIVGHANPMGLADEQEELMELSRNRAETMNSFLTQAGIVVMNVSWKGGNDRIADGSTNKGRSRNRRVEIFVEFE